MKRYMRIVLFMAAVASMLVVPGHVSADPNRIPTADDVLKQLAGNRTVSPGDLGQAIITKSMQLIRFLQSWAAPVTVILILIGGLMAALGLVFGSRDLKRLGIVGILGAVCGYVVIRLAPLLVVALSNLAG